MDILQQSLQAADILSGDDNDGLFGELGLTFNSSIDSIGLPNELQALASQGDALYNSDSGVDSQGNFGILANANEPSANFDTSQFLNTAAPVNIAVPGDSQKELQPVASNANSLNVNHEQYATQSQQGIQPVTISTQYQNSTSLPQTTVASVMPVTAALTHPLGKTITTMAHNVAVATCASVFSKLPTQTLTSSVQLRSTTPVANAHSYSVTPSMPISTPIQVVQPPNSLAAQQQGNRQLVTLVQKPGATQIPSSTASHGQTVVQNVNGLVMQPQQNNVAVVKIAGAKHGLSIANPQVMKALTANIIQKQQQQGAVQQSQPQFIKLAQNNTLINVLSQRQQHNVVRGTQQITLQNGRKILLNNGQQVQICTAQSPVVQNDVGEGASVEGVVSSNGTVYTAGSQAIKSNQVPIKGIQIASVNIPIASSSGNSSLLSNTGTMPGNAVLTIPVVTKHDASQRTMAEHTGVGGVATVAAMQAGTTQHSTVRSLLANAINKQIKTSTINGNNSQTIVQSSNTGAQLPNGQVSVQGQVGTMLRLNLTPQQASQLTPAQLQSILKQHQATLQAKPGAAQTTSVQLQSSTKPLLTTQPQVATAQKPTLPTTAVPGTVNNAPSADRSAAQIFKVPATITEAQVEEVKRLLTSRTIASKLNSLTREQQQLVLAFQAQIKTMSPPVQQYYLRNPQLFMQKVLQQTRYGKPFILQVKADALQKTKVSTTVSQSPKPQHPTISLTNDSNRTSLNTNKPNTQPAVTMNTQAAVRMVQSAIPTAPTTISVSRTAIKRSAPPEPPTKVTLVVEQLDCHKRMVMKPDCVNSFGSVRDAIRRLVPFHTCNIPNIEQEAFTESEKLFDQMSDRIMERTRAMVNKYHLLCLRDSTRDSCSADMVMIERMFLQKEKAKFAEDKSRLRENPSLITEYYPRRKSHESSKHLNADETMDSDLKIEANGDVLCGVETPGSAHRPILLPEDCPIINEERSPCISDGTNSTNRTCDTDRLTSRDSDTYARRTECFSIDSTPNKAPDDTLLQEAVDSILL